MAEWRILLGDCVGLAGSKHRILDQHLLLSRHAEPEEVKRRGYLHSCKKLSSSTEVLDSCEDVDSGDDGGVRKTGTSLRAAEILL